jgi:hypothetical protein
VSPNREDFAHSSFFVDSQSRGDPPTRQNCPVRKTGLLVISGREGDARLPGRLPIGATALAVMCVIVSLLALSILRLQHGSPASEGRQVTTEREAISQLLYDRSF